MIIIKTEYINSISEVYMLSGAYRKGLLRMNISKLAKELNCDRKTVYKALNGEITKNTRKRTSYLDSYIDILYSLLEDKNRTFEYINHLYKFMVREHKIQCCYSTFKRYIRKKNNLSEMFNKKKALTFIERFETEPGIQAQFDLKEKVTIIDQYQNKYKVNIPTLTLGFSRYNVRRITLSTSFEEVIAFLAEAFEEIEGVPKELVIDNIKCLIDKPRSGNKEAILNSKFEEFLKDYGIKCRPCMPNRPETKGKTETQNKTPGQLKNYNGYYKDLSEVHKKIKIINDEDNLAISQATNFPRIFLLEKEKDKLNPLPSKRIRVKYYLSLDEVNVTPDSLVSYKSNKYSVPKRYIGLNVNRIVKQNKLHIYYNNEIVTIHEIINQKINIKDEHELKYSRNMDIESKTKYNILEEMENIKYDND